MSKLLIRKKKNGPLTIDVTPDNANWQYVGFKSLRLETGEGYISNSKDEEICLVLVAGLTNIGAGDTIFSNIGERMSPFEHKLPYAVYLPPDTPYRIDALTSLEIGICSSCNVKGIFPVRLIKPEDVITTGRGKGANFRQINNIMMGETKAERLLVTEVLTPGGNWSSYPPHKHDQDRLPLESYLEETYYHHVSPPQGFVMQRVYTDNRSLDETMSVGDGECVLVPEGYHPVGVPYGYESYYLNTMAGHKREWKFHNDPDHEWILNKEK